MVIRGTTVVATFRLFTHWMSLHTVLVSCGGNRNDGNLNVISQNFLLMDSYTINSSIVDLVGLLPAIFNLLGECVNRYSIERLHEQLSHKAYWDCGRISKFNVICRSNRMGFIRFLADEHSSCYILISLAVFSSLCSIKVLVTYRQ